MASPQPLYINRFISGLYTQRSPLITPYTYTGLNRIERNDALIDGLNIELSNTFTLQRRPGFTKFCTSAFTGGQFPLNFYSYRQLSGTILPMADTSSTVYSFNGTTLTSVYTKGSAAQTSFRSVASTLYMANGTDAKKWDGTTVSGIGIATPVTAATLSFAAGSLSPTAGYQYVYVFKNSSTGHISTASPASASTGKFVSQNVTLVGSRSTDPQVNNVDIYRTLDGGSVYYFLATIANPGAGTWTYTDSTADSGLNTQLVAPVNHVNDPPPTGITNLAFHMGRMWGSTGNKVYFAAGPDCLNGVPEEAWPPANVFVFPGNVTALVSTDNGLLVFTSDNAYVVLGVDTQSFYSQLWMSNFGVLTQNAIARDGSTLYIYTTQGQLYSLSSSLDEVGQPIGDLLLSTVNPSTIYLTAHRSGIDKALYLSDGSTNLFRYSFDLNAWSSKYQPVGGINAIKSIETSAGVFTLLAGRATGNGFILGRSLSTFSDDGSTYPAFATIGTLLLAPPGQLTDLDSILLETMPVGSTPTVSVLPNEISGSFTSLGASPIAEPPQLPATTSVRAGRYYFKSSSTALPQLVRHLQVQITFPSEAAKNEILGVACQPTRIPLN